MAENMGMERKILLIGFHRQRNLDFYVEFLRETGFSVDPVASLDAMEERVRSGSYDACMMDTNLGYSMSESPESAQRIYGILESRIREGRVKFLSLSATPECVHNAKKLGIPAELVPYDKMF